MPLFGRRSRLDGHAHLLRHRRPRLRADLAQVPQRRHVLQGGRAGHGRRRDGQADDPHHPGGERAAPCHHPRPGRAARDGGRGGGRPRPHRGPRFLPHDDRRGRLPRPARRPGRGRAALRRPGHRAARCAGSTWPSRASPAPASAATRRAATTTCRRSWRAWTVQTRTRSWPARTGPCSSTTARHGQHAVRQPDALADAREAPEPELAVKIDAVAEPLRDYRHVDLQLPRATEGLDARHVPACSTGRPTRRRRSWPAASRCSTEPAARRSATSIERYQPMLGLHGHIHESQAAARIGPTLCINPGSEYGEGVLRGCLIDHQGRQGDGLPDDRRLTARRCERQSTRPHPSQSGRRPAHGETATCPSR